MNIIWFRRDLRLEDNTAFNEALKRNKDVLPIFIFDDDIIDELESDDPRVNFIYECLSKMNTSLLDKKSSLLILRGKVELIWNDLIKKYPIKKVYFNHDYEPYALKRDQEVTKLLEDNGIIVETFKDHVIFEKDEITKKDGLPYSIYTPFKNKWFLTWEKWIVSMQR